jgi:hypothetical protein
MKTDFEAPPEIYEEWRKLGYADETISLLPLVPAIQVAWAEGFLQAGERRTILQIFAETRNDNGEQHDALLRWLDERPSDEFFAAANGLMSRWLAKISPAQAAVLRDFLHASCLKVAGASHTIGLKTGSQTICREERRRLELLGNQLGFTLA